MPRSKQTNKQNNNNSNSNNNNSILVYVHAINNNNNNNNLELREIGWDGMDWIDLAQDRDQWWALVNTVMNLRVP
jgi:hypothetical protein